MKSLKPLAVCAAALAILVLASIGMRAYTTFGSWGSAPALMYINPQNADVSASAAEAAELAAMDVWNTQGGTPFRFAYGGRTGDNNVGFNGTSVVMFRNENQGGTLGSSYAWSVNGVLVESDVVFWDGGFTFFTGASGCSGGMYIEDVAAHELGHSAGLGHSEVGDATMYPSATSYCSQSWRTLTSDDVAALRSLYGSGSGGSGGSAPASPNTAPSVSISSPANGSSYAEGTAMSFSGSASDAQEGNMTASIIWRSNIDGTLGSGSGFWRTLSPGTHAITATVTDSGNLTTAVQVGVTVNGVVESSPPALPPPPPPSGAVLSARAYKQRGLQRVDLWWSGLSSSSVDVYRSGGLVSRTANDGAHTDPINRKGSGSYTYTVCETGTSTCTNQVTVTF